MNEKYIYADGKVVVIDSNGGSIRDYTDNIEDILVKENIVEKTEKELEKEKENLIDLKSYKKLLLKYYGGGITVAGIGLAGAIALLTPIHGSPLLAWTGVATFSTGLTILEIGLIRRWIFNYQEIKKEINGTEREIKFLTKKLAEEKDNLINIKQSITTSKEQEFAEEHSLANNSFTQINDEKSKIKVLKKR